MVVHSFNSKPVFEIKSLATKAATAYNFSLTICDTRIFVLIFIPNTAGNFRSSQENPILIPLFSAIPLDFSVLNSFNATIYLLKKPQTGTSRNKFCHLFHHLLHLVSMSFACRDTWVVNTTSILARSFVIISLLSVMADWVLKATVLSCEPRTVHEASGLPDLYAGNLNYAFVIRRRWIRLLLSHITVSYLAVVFFLYPLMFYHPPYTMWPAEHAHVPSLSLYRQHPLFRELAACWRFFPLLLSTCLLIYLFF